MKNMAVVLALAYAISWSAAAQPGPTATSGIPGLPTIIDDIETKRAEWTEELDWLREQLHESLVEQARLEAVEGMLKARVPAAMKSLARAKAEWEEAAAKKDDVEKRYAEHEAAARKKFVDRLIAEYKQKMLRKYDALMAAHRRDAAFIEANQWTPSDFDGLKVRQKDEDGTIYTLKFEYMGTVSGGFSTTDISNGKKIWHTIPDDAAYTVSMDRTNPFLVDVTIRPGFAVGPGEKGGDVHVFIAKHFDERRRSPATRFEVAAVSWTVDAGRRLCWQNADPPVFFATPKPQVPPDPTEETPAIALLLRGWRWDDEGWEMRCHDAREAHSFARLKFKAYEDRVPRIEKDAKTRLEEIVARLAAATEQVEEFRMKIEEVEILLGLRPDPNDDGFGDPLG